MLFRPPSTSKLEIWWVIYSDSSLSSPCSLLPLTSHLALPLSCLALFFLPPTLPLLLLFYVPLLPSICISSLLSSTSVSSSSSPLLLFTSTTCLLFLLSPHFHLLFPNVCPSFLSQLNHFSPHLIFPSPAPVICIPLSFSLSATFNFPFYHLHSCPLFPPPTGPVQCLRRGRWPPLCSQALLWRLVLLVPGQIQPGQETPHHGSYTVHQTHLLLLCLCWYLLSRADNLESPGSWF